MESFFCNFLISHSWFVAPHKEILSKIVTFFDFLKVFWLCFVLLSIETLKLNKNIRNKFPTNVYIGGNPRLEIMSDIKNL